MALLKLESTNAFVVRDFDDDVPALGIVRAAPKILQGGAKELARSQTYQCALFNMRCQGASAGINAAPDERQSAIEAFVAELTPAAVTGSLMLDAGKGVADEALSSLFEADPRNDAHRRLVDGIANRLHLTGLGAVASADTARSLDGARVAIDHFEVTGPAVARAAAARGARITSVATSAGSVTNADGFDVAELTEAAQQHGAGLVNELASGDPDPAWKLLGADVDVLFVGTKMGQINHAGAPHVKAAIVAPTASIPYTTKAAIMLERQGSTVLPDAVTTAGAMFASMPPDGDDQESIERSVVDLISTLTSQILSGDDMPILEACHRAESFMSTWRDKLPFGRPFAS